MDRLNYLFINIFCKASFSMRMFIDNSCLISIRLLRFLLISNMKSVLLYDSYFNNSRRGGFGLIPSHIRSVNVKHTTGPIKINIQNFDITNLSYRGRYMLNSDSASSCYRLAKSLCYRLTKYYNQLSSGRFFQNAS